jgi:hypothetical protein
MFETNTQNALSSQEKEFHMTFKIQMKLVEETLDSLKNDINQNILKEQTDKKFQKIIAERNFFRKQALFLNEQNNSKVIRVNSQSKGIQRYIEATHPRKRSLQNACYPRKGKQVTFDGKRG